MNLTTEEKVLLLISGFHPSEKVISEIKAAIGIREDRFDFDKLFNLAVKNGVIQIAYQNLKHIEGVPKDLRSKMKNVYLHTSADNLRKINELLKIIGILKQNGTPVIPIKGALASEMIFGNPGLYHGVDIDLLVDPTQLKDTKRLLMEQGYIYSGQPEQDMLSSHYHLAFNKGKFFIEVHWNLVKRYFDIPSDFWWEDTRIVNYDGRNILCLAPEKYLMAMIFRLFSHMFNPLKFLVIIDALFKHYKKDLNWDLFLKYVETYRMKRLSVFTLTLLNELFDTPVPFNLKTEKIFGYSTIKKEILIKLFRDKRNSYYGKLLYLFLLDSPLDFINLILWRLIPSKSELRMRYHLPEQSNWIYVYYILNPFLLPYLILKKRSDG